MSLLDLLGALLVFAACGILAVLNIRWFVRNSAGCPIHKPYPPKSV